MGLPCSSVACIILAKRSSCSSDCDSASCALRAAMMALVVLRISRTSFAKLRPSFVKRTKTFIGSNEWTE